MKDTKPGEADESRPAGMGEGRYRGSQIQGSSGGTSKANPDNEKEGREKVIRFSRTLLILTAAVFGIALRAQDAPARPNVIFILADDWGYGDVKCLGGDRCKIETPHMDKLAKDGMIFTDAHSTSAVCTPTRYSVLTGRYNWRSPKKSGVLGGFSPRLIEKDRTTVAGLMKDNGYQAACIGKWHLGMNFPKKAGSMGGVNWKGVIKEGPIAVGFTHFYGISASLDMPPYIWVNDDKFEGECTVTKAFHRKGPAHKDFEAVDVLPTIAKKSVEYIKANKDKPIFMYIPLNSPHTPIVPSKHWVGKSKIGKYGDFVMETDWAIGQVVKAIDDAGLSEKTLIIVTADNGCSPAARGPNKEVLVFNGSTKAEVQPDKHYPCKNYRGHKADIYEGGHRVPFIARWTDKIKAGSTCNDTVCLVDLYATCAELIGKKLDDKDAPDSVSMVPLLLGKKPEKHREATVHHSINGSFAIRQGKWKLALCPGSGGWSAPKPPRRRKKKNGAQPAPAPVIKQWVQLYDLEADVGETKNLAAEHPDTVKRLTNLLQQYVNNGRSTPGAKQENSGETHIYPNWIRGEVK